jgi:ArsR family transcriptional regulator
MENVAIDPVLMREAANSVADRLKILANPERLLLLCQLSQGERCVSDLEVALDIRQPTLSQQLGVLRAEGVVSTRRDGKYVYYRVADDKLLRVLATLYDLYCPKEAS